MPAEEEPDIAEVADAIFNYLSELTSMADSEEVIAQWLNQHDYTVGLEETRRALEYLKAVGLVIESPGRHGKTMYKSTYASTGEI
jgi:predicted transcriptional regulator